MKILSFQVKNYKSINDSGICRLSEADNITVLAGQNESGKSSILQALRDYEDGSIITESFRDDDTYPLISCTYGFDKKDIDVNEILGDESKFPATFRKVLEKISELTFVRKFDSNGDSVIEMDEHITAELRSIIDVENNEIERRNAAVAAGESTLEHEAIWKVEETMEEIVFELFSATPRMIFFDDFCDLLPDQVLISDLKGDKDIKGLQAVKNIETILKADFSKLDQLNDGKRETTQNTYHETITASFNEKWKQRIAEGNGAKIHVKYYQGHAENASYLKFYIETKKGEYLSAGRRSQGFKWFLSFFLQLKAEDERAKQLIILFDEPGLFLHSKAQADMIAVFEELAVRNQIIYSTHSPYLIDTSKIHRVKLVLNTRERGTAIEKITSSKVGDQKDALKPIIDALGLEVVTAFSVGNKNNVIVEGMSDFFYLQGMRMILNGENDFAILPSMGASNVHLLMELCIGWGLNWVIIFDDKGATRDFNKIVKHFFDESSEEAAKKIYRIKNCDGIEDAFTADDMKLIHSNVEVSSSKKNSEIVQQYGGKVLFARLFYEKVVSGKITKKKLSESTIREFSSMFNFIKSALKI